MRHGRSGRPAGRTAVTNVAIIYHSGYGHTRAQAEAVRDGARSVPGVHADLIAVEEHADNWEVLDTADAIIFGTPTYMAGVSAPFKAFLDASSDRWAKQKWKDKLAAGFTNSAGANGDKLATLQQLALFAMQHGMVGSGSACCRATPPAPARRRNSTGSRASSARWRSPSPTWGRTPLPPRRTDVPRSTWGVGSPASRSAGKGPPHTATRVSRRRRRYRHERRPHRTGPGDPRRDRAHPGPLLRRPAPR
ncbi:flavodoxin family protein [Micromonospora coxensis]|uniref:flavodoxin family protein n=1 Tax=Micromonospora coxensis TaxID=356852 RepID=UPI003431E4B0